MAARTDSTIKPLQKYDRDATGSTVIPSSVRPDGTLRKAIRVKDGFVPQDEIPAFKTKQVVQFSTPRPAVLVGFDPVVKDDNKKEPSKSAIKRARQKAKKMQAESLNETTEKLGALALTKKSS